MNISIHFLWQEGNCWNDLRADWCHQEHSLLQTMRLEKRDKRFIFSRSSAAGFDGETKEFSPSLHFTFSLLSFALCSSFSRQSQSSLAMAQSALPSPDAWALGSSLPVLLPAMRVATFSLIDCQIEIGTANARQKLHFTLNLIEQKSPASSSS